MRRGAVQRGVVRSERGEWGVVITLCGLGGGGEAEGERCGYVWGVWRGLGGGRRRGRGGGGKRWLAVGGGGGRAVGGSWVCGERGWTWGGRGERRGSVKKE